MKKNVTKNNVTKNNDRYCYQKLPVVLEFIFKKTKEIVLIHPEYNFPYLLKGNSVIRMWQILRNPTSIKEIVDKICREFLINRTTVKDDVKKLLDFLIKNKLIRKIKNRFYSAKFLQL